jgi:diadenosine tetraphosphatase ApaH/serine/threonine PP2A family protein phosphatase
MRYLVLSDTHANLEALETVLGDAPEHDAVIFLGDLVGYGPNPNEVVERIRDIPNLTTLLGNHDWAALGRLDLNTFNPYARAAAEWTMETLTEENTAYLASLEGRLDLPDMTLAHASPRDPIWEYLESPFQGPPNFEAFETRLCLVGHTHVPRVFVETDSEEFSRVFGTTADQELALDDGRMIVNPGGVGQPRDGDPRAAYGILDTERNVFLFRRVAYPVEETQRKMIEAGLPGALAQRLSYGL